MEIEWVERGVTQWDGAISEFLDKFPRRKLEFVDEKEVMYMCEGCRMPIFEGEIVYQWEDVETCEKCGGPEQIKRIA